MIITTGGALHCKIKRLQLLKRNCSPLNWLKTLILIQCTLLIVGRVHFYFAQKLSFLIEMVWGAKFSWFNSSKVKFLLHRTTSEQMAEISFNPIMVRS